VNEARQAFFADTAFADEQHVGVDFCNAGRDADDAEHGGTEDTQAELACDTIPVRTLASLNHEALVGLSVLVKRLSHGL
jgi:hypothetical protein